MAVDKIKRLYSMSMALSLCLHYTLRGRFVIFVSYALWVTIIRNTSHLDNIYVLISINGEGMKTW